MRSEELRHFREQLQAERDAIESRIASRNKAARQNVREESGVDDHGDDTAGLLFDRDSDVDASALDRDTLAKVDAALRRIDEGTYGLSVVSGKPIPIERLKAVPYATTLVNERPPEQD